MWLLLITLFNNCNAQDDQLKMLIQKAVSQNPKIVAAKHMVEAAHERVVYKGTLPDPQLSGAVFGESIQTRVGPQKAKIGIAQKIPFPGKLSAIKNTIREEEGIAELQYEIIKRNTINEIKKLYYKLFSIDKTIQILNEEKEIVKVMGNTARKKYETNQAPQQDVLKADMTITKITYQIYKKEQERNTVVAQLKKLTSENSLNIAPIRDIKNKYLRNSLEEMKNQATKHRQELLVSKRIIEKSMHNERTPSLRGLPDITVGLDYFIIGDGETKMDNDGTDAWAVIGKVNLPLWFPQNRAETKESHEQKKVAENYYESEINAMEYAIEDIYYKLQTQEKIIKLYENAYIPQTEQAFAASRISYENNTSDFLNWLDTELKMLEVKIAYHNERARYEILRADLEKEIGNETKEVQ
ncbi:TolC family protein [Candidatus Margulisiibacteriota bacterium]